MGRALLLDVHTQGRPASLWLCGPVGCVSCSSPQILSQRQPHLGGALVITADPARGLSARKDGDLNENSNTETSERQNRTATHRGSNWTVLLPCMCLWTCNLTAVDRVLLDVKVDSGAKISCKVPAATSAPTYCQRAPRVPHFSFEA